MPTVPLYAGWHQISLWTRTNPIRNLCVWVRVWMYDCAHVFCTVVVKVHVAAFFVDDWRSWPLRGKTELLESVSCAIKASFLPLSGGLPLCPSLYQPHQQPCHLLKRLPEVVFSCAFHTFPHGASQCYSHHHLTGGQRATHLEEMLCFIMEKQKTTADCLNIIELQVCFCLTRTFRLHCCTSFFVGQSVKVTASSM